MSKKSSKIKDDLPDSIERIPEYTHDGFTFANPRLIQRYVEGKLNILVHCRIREINQEIIACFQVEAIRPNPIEPCNSRSWAGSDVWLGLGQMFCNVEVVKSDASCKQQSVLVPPIEGVEPPESVIPSLVWFDRPDRVNSVLFQALYFSRKAGLVLRGTRDFIEDGECILRSCNPAIFPNEGRNQIVERTPEVLHGIACDERDFRRDFFYLRETVVILTRLRIAIYGDFVGVGVDEAVIDRVEILDVLFGPLDL